MHALFRLCLCVGLLVVASVTVSNAQSGVTSGGQADTVAAAISPDAIVKTIYASYRGMGLGTSPTDPDLRDYYSARLRPLLAAEDDRIERNGIGQLDFDIFVDAQDWDITDLDIGAPQIAGQSAVVPVSMLNFGEPRQFRYLFVLEEGAWRIDDIVAVRETDPWQLTALLAGN